MSRTHRFRVVPALGLQAARDDASRVLGQGLGLPLVDADEVSLSFGLGKLALFVDAREDAAVARGFLPMLAIDDIAWAIERLRALGCTTSPMPWAPDNPGVLVTAPSGIAFCVVPETQVHGVRAERAMQEISSEGRAVPRQISGLFSRAEPAHDDETS